jgi:hypothetical protein
MWLNRLFSIIDKTAVGKVISNKQGIIESTDPDRIYVENIRSFFNLPFSVAKYLCDMAVKSNLFKRKVGVECPNCGRLIKVYENLNEIEPKIHCEVCELNEEEKFDFESQNLKKVTFYQLVGHGS